jgi:pyruvate ferredoxin oxidoreductase alpha subunit
VSLKLFRPFPVRYLREIFSMAKLVVVFDRDVGYGYEGILSYELKAALYAAAHHPIIRGFIVGLGGRDITPETLIQGIRQAITEQSNPEAATDIYTTFLGTKFDQLGFSKEGN